MNYYNITKVNVGSLVTVVALFYLILGAMIGVFAVLATGLGADHPNWGVLFFAYVLAVTFYTIIGGIGAAIAGWSYNLIANFTGGVQVHLEGPPVPAPGTATLHELLSK